jgi:hypothetical protein
MCKDLVGDITEEEKIRRMSIIAEDYIVERDKITKQECINKVKMNDEPTLQDLINGELLYRKEIAAGKNKVHSSEMLQKTEKIKRYRKNMHAVNILRMIGINNWLQEGILIYNLDYNRVNEYLHENIDDFPDYNTVSDDRLRERINQLLKVFNISSLPSKARMARMKNGEVRTCWKLDNDGIIRPI